MPSTPYMSLFLPTVSATIGPDWATDLNNALTAIDQHDHSPGFGKPITATSITIDSDLPFGGNDAIHLRSTRFDSQGSVLSAIDDLSCIYSVGGNLYWNNGSGTPIQITAGGALNAASIGAIGGDYATSTASEFYTTASDLFTFWKASNTPAQIEAGPITLRYKSGFTPPPTGSQPKGITIAAPNIASPFTLTLPLALPGSTKILTLDSSGNIASAYDVDGSSLQVSGNVLGVKAGGITAAMLNSGTTDEVTIENSGGNIHVKAGGLTNTHVSASAAIARSKLEATNFYNTAGVVATGTSTLSGVLAGNTITIAGHAFTAVSGTPTGDQFQVNASNTVTAANLAAAINASVTVGIAGVVKARSSSNIVYIGAITPGTAGNSITLAQSGGHITLSGATLTGGSSGALNTYTTPGFGIGGGVSSVGLASAWFTTRYANSFVQVVLGQLGAGKTYLSNTSGLNSNQTIQVEIYVDGVAWGTSKFPVNSLSQPNTVFFPLPTVVATNLTAGLHFVEARLISSLGNDFEATGTGAYVLSIVEL